MLKMCHCCSQISQSALINAYSQIIWSLFHFKSLRHQKVQSGKNTLAAPYNVEALVAGSFVSEIDSLIGLGSALGLLVINRCTEKKI